ncbi:MAG: HYC_CC_PP family protein [Candidatus Saccharibacteria bacterium]
MKNILTIVLASFILISGMHLSIARHICGGKLADVNLSFSEAVAACGMETDATTCATHEKATSDCCRNEITKLSVDDYFAASSLQLKEVTQPLTVLFFLPLIQSLYSVESEVQAFADVGTQANIIVREVSLPKICVFRI